MLANTNQSTPPNDDAFELVPQDTLDVTLDEDDVPSSPPALNSPSLAPPRLVRQQSEDFVVLKVERPDAPGSYRRFLVDHPCQPSAYQALTANVAAAFPTLGGQDFHLHFRDSEGDLCVISSDVELAEAIHVTVREQAKSLRLKVALKRVPTPKSSPCSPVLAGEPVLVSESKAATPPAQASQAFSDPQINQSPGPAVAQAMPEAPSSVVSVPAATGLRHRVLPSRVNGKARVIITAVPAPLGQAARPPPPSVTLTPSRGPKEPETKRAKPAGPGAFACSHCHANIVNGTRFSCTVCPAFDLCVACEAKDVHSALHPLTKTKALPAPADPPPPADLHVGVTCDACGVSPIQGVRFKCQTCPDFDLCAACEATNAHPADHALYKLRVSTAATRPFAPARAALPQHAQQAWTPPCSLLRCGAKLLLLPLLVLLFSCVAKPLALVAILCNVFQAARKQSRLQTCRSWSCDMLTFFVLSWILGGYGRGVTGMLALSGLSFVARGGCQQACAASSSKLVVPQMRPQMRPFWIPARFFRNPSNNNSPMQSAAPQAQPQAPQSPGASRAAAPQPATAAAFPEQPFGRRAGAVSNVSEVDAAVFAEQLQLLDSMGFGAHQSNNVRLLKQFGGNVNHVVNLYMDQPAPAAAAHIPAFF